LSSTPDNFHTNAIPNEISAETVTCILQGIVTDGLKIGTIAYTKKISNPVPKRKKPIIIEYFLLVFLLTDLLVFFNLSLLKSKLIEN